MTNGRAAWNIVTSLNDGEAQNMGRDEVIGHDLRYDRADEFMEIVLGHWDTWEDDAIVQDKASGLFAKPEKVHRLDYQGRYFRSRGPFTVPRSAQGHPVLIQAGSSGRGKAFGARWGEVIFVVYPNIDDRPTRLCGVQGGGGALSPRSRGGQDHPPRQHRGGGDQSRGRGQMGGDREAAARDRRAVAVVGGAQLRLCAKGHG